MTKSETYTKTDYLVKASNKNRTQHKTNMTRTTVFDDPNDLSTWACNRGFDFAVQEQWGSRFGGIQYDGEMHWINGKKDSVYYNFKEWECKDDFRTSIAFDYLDTLNTEKPFFLFMSYRAPHGHEYEIGNMELYADKGWSAPEQLHASKITLLDKQIGRLLNKLDEMGELENTLIVFTSDNGPYTEGAGHNPEFFDSNGELRGIKRDLYEGGIRVPMTAMSARIDNWKGVRYGIISKTELYNIDVDISESNNIAEEHPGIVQQMEKLFQENHSETEGFPYDGVVQDYKAKDKF